MSAGSASLGRVVLTLATDDSALRRGLEQAKQDTATAGRALRENARVVLSADAALLRADLARAQQLVAQGKAGAAKDLTYQLRTDAGLLRAGLADAERQARAAKDGVQAALLYRIRTDLPQFAADLRTVERAATTSARQIAEAEQAFARQTAAERRRLSQQAVQDARQAAQQGRQAARAAAPTPQAAGGGGSPILSGFVGGATAGLVTAGLDFVRRSAGAGQQALIGYNRELETVRATLVAFTGSQITADNTLRDLRTEADKTPFTFRQMADSIATLVPLSRQSGVALTDLIKLTETLAALNPDEAQGGGFRGAALALGNAQSGDLTSLRDRFNINTTAIAQYKNQGLSSIEAIRRGLKDLGIDESLVAGLSQTFSGQLSNVQDALASLAGRAGQPLFDEAKRDLGTFAAALQSGQVKAAVDELTRGIASGIADLRAFLSRRDVQEHLLTIGEAAKQAGLGVVGLARDLGGALGPALGVTAGLVKGLNGDTVEVGLSLGLLLLAVTKLPGPLLEAQRALAALRVASASFAATGSLGLGATAAIAAPIAAIGLSLIAVNETAKTLTGESLPDLIGSVIKYGDAWARGREEAEKALNAVKQGADPQSELARLQARVDEAQRVHDAIEALRAQNPIEVVAQLGADLQSGVSLKNAKEALETYTQLVAVLHQADRERLRLAEGLPVGFVGPIAATPRARSSPATLPESEAQFDITAKANQAAAYTARYTRDTAEFRRFVQGFKAEDFDVFSKLRPQLQGAFDQLYGSLTPTEQIAKGGGEIDVLTARIADDIRTIGHVSGETERQVRQAFGAQADAILRSADSYGTLRAAQETVTRATNDLKTAQDGLTAAQQTAQTHQDGLRDSLDGLHQSLSDLNQESATTARGYTEQLDTLQQALATVQRQQSDAQRVRQDQLAAAQRVAADAQQEFQVQLRVAQGEQSAAQEAATQHAAAYAAVLAGTTTEFLRQNDALDEQSRRILATGDAAVAAQLKAKTAADAGVQSLEVKQRRELLALDERIRAARQPGGAGEAAARALEDQRKLVQARADYALNLARQQAAVRGDELDAAKKPVEQAAQDQSDVDKRGVTAAQTRVAEIQEQARLRGEADRAAIQALQDQAAVRAESDRATAQALQDRIAGVQQEAKRVADDYAARGRAIQGTIDQETARGKIVAATDKQAVADAQTRVNDAKTVKDNADLEVVAQQAITTNLGQQNTLLETRFGKWKDFFENVLKPSKDILDAFSRAAPPPPSLGPGGAQGGGRDARVTTPEVSGAPDPGDTPPPPGPAIGPRPQPSSYSRAALFAPLPTVAVAPPAAPVYRLPDPPPRDVAALAGAGAGASFARAGLGNGPITLNAPISFPDATFTSDIDVKRAVQEGQEAGLRGFLAALDGDVAGGGAISGWRG